MLAKNLLPQLPTTDYKLRWPFWHRQDVQEPGYQSPQTTAAHVASPFHRFWGVSWRHRLNGTRCHSGAVGRIGDLKRRTCWAGEVHDRLHARLVLGTDSQVQLVHNVLLNCLSSNVNSVDDCDFRGDRRVEIYWHVNLLDGAQ